MIAKHLTALFALHLLAIGIAPGQPAAGRPMSKVPPPGAIGSLDGTVTRGGVVVVGYPSPPEFTPYSATASVGDDAQSIRSDLEEKVLAVMMDGAVVRQGQEDVHRATHLHLPMYIAGDDVGLGFTPAPSGVTAFMNWETKRVEIGWKLPAGGDYDHTWMAGMFGSDVFELDPLQTRYHKNVHEWIYAEKMTGLKPGQYMFSMIGLLNGIPSARRACSSTSVVSSKQPIPRS